MNGIRQTCEGGQSYFKPDPKGERIVVGSQEVVVLGNPTFDESWHGPNSMSSLVQKFGVYQVEQCGISEANLAMGEDPGRNEAWVTCALCGLDVQCKRGRLLS